MTFDPGANTYLPPSPVVPAHLLITAITNSNPMQITTTGYIPHNVYIPGQLVRLSVPYDYKMYQADGLTAQILAVNGSVFSVSVNSLGFDPFVIPTQSTYTPAPASLSPAGSRNTYNFTTLPFHSLANRGN